MPSYWLVGIQCISFDESGRPARGVAGGQNLSADVRRARPRVSSSVALLELGKSGPRGAPLGAWPSSLSSRASSLSEH